MSIPSATCHSGSQRPAGGAADQKVDAIADLTLDLAKRLDGNAELTTLKTFPYCQQYFVIHAANGPTANPLIRQAIREVVNVDDITGATGILSQTQSFIALSGEPYYAGEMATTFYDQKSPAKAKELLKQAGYNGEKLICRPTRTTRICAIPFPCFPSS